LVDEREGPIAKSQGSFINISLMQCTIHELFRVDAEQTLSRSVNATPPQPCPAPKRAKPAQPWSPHRVEMG
jgi:hypothetical protein